MPFGRDVKALGTLSNEDDAYARRRQKNSSKDNKSFTASSSDHMYDTKDNRRSGHVSVEILLLYTNMTAMTSGENPLKLER